MIVFMSEEACLWSIRYFQRVPNKDFVITHKPVTQFLIDRYIILQAFITENSYGRDYSIPRCFGPSPKHRPSKVKQLSDIFPLAG